MAAALGLSASTAAAQDLQPPPPMDSSQPSQQPPPAPQDQPPPPQGQQPPPAQPQPAPPPSAQPAPQPASPPQPAPPPPTPAPASTSSSSSSGGTEQQLDRSKQEDSGRGMEFLYLNAQGGYAYNALQSLSQSNPLQMQNTDVGGPMIGAEAGVRLLFFTLGMRFRYQMLQPFNFWQLNLVAGFHIPVGKWDPYFAVYGGYSSIGNVSKDNLDTTVVGALPAGVTSQDIANGMNGKGGNVGLSFGVDYYLASFLSFGLDAGFEFLFLHRDPLALPPGIDPALLANNPYYQNSGDAAGTAVNVSAHLGLHL